MGNEHNWEIIIFQGFEVPSKPLIVTFVGL
jgi:hypothetical protein